jgi:hypothetical protein
LEPPIAFLLSSGELAAVKPPAAMAEEIWLDICAKVEKGCWKVLVN